MNLNVIKWTAQRLAILLLLAAAGHSEAALTGPTLHLDYGRGEAHDNPIATFMYFVPLISPDHVSVFTDAGNSQCARVLSFTCRTNDATFRASCEFDFTGSGSQRNVFDLSDKIKLNEPDLQSGTVLKHVLTAINISGTGSGIVEIEGTLTNGQQVVNLVRLRFDRHGHTSPVTINLEDISMNNDAIQVKNELVARVNMLTFERKPGTPKMEVSLASIKRKDAGNGLWQSFWGGLKGVTANLFLPPLTIEREGQQAMLKFGLALATESPEFTFPFARRLKTPQITALNRNE